MSAQTLYLSILASSMTLTESPNPAALASVELVTQYAFDSNVVAKVVAVDEKTFAPSEDPLNNLVFKISFSDKIDGSVLTELKGRLYTGGGVEALEEQHADDFSYITGKLDFYGALDSNYDFFESVNTSYSANDAAAIMTALDAMGALNELGAFRTKEVELAVPASTVTDLTPKEIKNALLDMRDRPRYLVCCEVASLPNIEALAEVMGKINCHVLLDIGNITDWQSAVALTETLSINDHRFWVFWNPNKSRPSTATTVLARKKWRPCVGDYLAQLLIRNAASNAAGIPPIYRPIAGYDFPVSFRDMEKISGLTLDEEAQNALASAGVNVVINERFEGGDRFIYGDALTQYNSKTSALRLINSSEIETYTANVVIGITKKHLLKGMSSFIKDATSECERFLDACVVDDSGKGLLVRSSELGGRYYALSITPRADDPFSKADIKFSRRPQGCARQAFLETTVTK
ncbi:hypothetical protein ACTXGL_09730 [Psychrobacter sp. T6-6]|uniref:hypothetical protein n=1 Tax=Psychrobacter sp. T6-6 TaxID=3457452 RepID=UPI003FD27E9F